MAKILAYFTITKSVEVEIKSVRDIVKVLDKAKEELEQEYQYNINDWKYTGYTMLYED